MLGRKDGFAQQTLEHGFFFAQMDQWAQDEELKAQFPTLKAYMLHLNEQVGKGEQPVALEFTQ